MHAQLLVIFKEMLCHYSQFLVCKFGLSESTAEEGLCAAAATMHLPAAPCLLRVSQFWPGMKLIVGNGSYLGFVADIFSLIGFTELKYHKL